LVVGALSAVGKLRVARLAALNVDGDARASVMAFSGGG
jgi:hypothetical protein